MERRSVAVLPCFLVLLLAIVALVAASCGGGGSSGGGYVPIEVRAVLVDPVNSSSSLSGFVATAIGPSGSAPFRAIGSASEVTAVRLTVWDCGTGGACDPLHATPILDEALTFEPITGAYARQFDATFVEGRVYEFRARAYKNTDDSTDPTTWDENNRIFDTVESTPGYWQLYTVTLSGNNVLINLIVEDDGQGYMFPRILSIAIDPSLILPGSSNTTIAFTVGSAAGGAATTDEVFTWQLSGGANEGSFTAYDDLATTCTGNPIAGNTGTLTIPSGDATATQTICFQAPSAQGFFAKSIQVTNAVGDSVTVTFYVYVTLDAISNGIQVYLPPSILSVNAAPSLTNDVQVSAEVVDDKPLSGLLYSWSFGATTNSAYSYLDFRATPTGSTTAGSNPATIFHYTPDVAGTITLSVSDADGMVSNSVNVNLAQDQFPEAVMPLGAFAAQRVSAATGGSGYHTCMVLSGGNAACWGYNNYGGLGDGTTTNRSRPVKVRTSATTLLTGATKIATGNGHSCAIAGGQAYCWGYDGYGQLGNDSTEADKVYAVQTAGISNATQLALGLYHSCALESGAARCWGYNFYGNVGDGTSGTGTDRQLPVLSQLAGGVPIDGSQASATAIAAGAYFTCAVLGNGSAGDHTGEVWCWGRNDQGQLGRAVNGATLPSANTAAPVQLLSGGNLTGAVAVTAGDSHACALLGDATVLCWGYNAYGQLGTNNNTARTSAVEVVIDGSGTPLSSVGQVDAGGNHTCARLSDGTLRCWGYNNYGQLGNGTVAGNPPNSNLPVAVHPVADTYVDVSTGDNHTCAVRPSGHVRCWGYNAYGGIGDGTTVERHRPVGVDMLTLFQ